MTTMLSSLEKG